MKQQGPERYEDASGLEEAADRAAAEPSPDWEEIADIKREAEELRVGGEPDEHALDLLRDRARAAVPAEGWAGVLAETLAAIDGTPHAPNV